MTAAAAVADLWSKTLWVYPDPERLGNEPTRKVVIEGWLLISAVWNEGGVWSAKLPKWLLLGAAIVAVPLITWWIFSPKKVSAWETGAKALVLGGAIGNLWDRALFGKVRDWIDVYLWGYNYPVFNVADAALLVGIVILLISSFFGSGKKASE